MTLSRKSIVDRSQAVKSVEELEKLKAEAELKDCTFHPQLNAASNKKLVFVICYIIVSTRESTQLIKRLIGISRWKFYF